MRVYQRLYGWRMLCGALLWVYGMHSSEACTRILWNDHQRAVVVGRTMDWPESTEPVLTVFPRGIEREGGLFAGVVVDSDNPARWTSKYGSVIVSVYGAGTVDGVNEKGLGVHALYLTATDFGPRNPALQGVQAGLFAQFMLDNAASVADALALVEGVQPIMVEVEGMKATLHFAIEDATGDSAIIEYIAGEPVIHHGREFRIMTNDPRYEDQLAHLAQFDFSNATRQTPLPGNVDPKDRFVRAAYYLHMLREPTSEREAIASILAIARNASVPFGAPNNLPGSLYNTEYRTAINLTDRRYYFELSTSPNVIWVDLSRLNVAPDAPVLVLDPDDIYLSGDVTDKFKAIARAPF